MAAFLPQTGEGLLSFRRREMGLPGGSGSRRPYLPGGGPSFIDRSIACTCLVSAPIEMQSTPSSAIARNPGRSTPPETSTGIARLDWKSVERGERVSESVDLGGRRRCQKKKE